MIDYIKQLLTKFYHAFCVDGDDFSEQKEQDEEQNTEEDTK